MNSKTLQIYKKCKHTQGVAFKILLGLDTQTCTTKKLVDGTAERVDELTEKARRSVLLHLNQVISDRESIAPRLIPCSRHVYFITVLREIVSIIEQSLNRHENCYTKEPTTFTVPKEIVPEMSTSELEIGPTSESTISELREQSIEEIEDGVFLGIIQDLLQRVKDLWSKATKDDIFVATAAAGKLP